MNASLAAPDEFECLVELEGTAMVPRLSTAALLAHPKNAALRALMTEPPSDPTEFRGRRVALIVTDGVEEMELTLPLRYLRARGATVDILAPPKPAFPDHLGVQMPAIRGTHLLTIRYIELGGWVRFDKLVGDANPADYDALYIPGGAWNPDALRADAQVLAFVRRIHADGKLIATLCHGPWVIADAGLLKGRRATAWWAMRKDIENAGATYIDEPVVVDGPFITARHPIDLAPFLTAVGERLAAITAPSASVAR